MTELTMPFGKHRGKHLNNVPATYLMWFLEQPWSDKWPKVKTYCIENYEALQIDATEESAELALICCEPFTFKPE
jgi:hypothetical protein